MTIKIAAFGSEQFLNRLVTLAENVTDLTVVPYVYRHPEETPLILKQATDCDVLLFTGMLPYFFAKQTIREVDIPAVSIPFHETMVTLSLFHIYYHKRVPLARISIDIPDRQYVDRVLAELDIQETPLHVQDYKWIFDDRATGRLFDVDQFVAVHERLWQAHKVDVVLTSIHAVYDRLKAKGVDCVRMIDSEENMMASLKRAKAVGQLEKSKRAQIAVGIVALDRLARQTDDGTQAHNDTLINDDIQSHDDTKTAIHKMRRALAQFANRMNASVQYVDEEKGKMMLYSTRGGVEHVTNRFRDMRFLYALEEALQMTVRAGFGFGVTAKDAEEHAQIALAHARQTEGMSSAFIVTEEQLVIGPLNVTREVDRKKYHLRTVDKHIQRIAQQTRLSVSNVTKVLAFNRARGGERFTSHQLADYLGVSRRTAERILKKLHEERFVHVVGEEQPYQHGRPRAVYELADDTMA